MPETTQVDVATTAGDQTGRLRTDVYRALAAVKGYKTVEDLARLHGLNRATLFDLLGGKTQPLLGTAMRMASDLGVAVEVIWERVAS